MFWGQICFPIFRFASSKTDRAVWWLFTL